MTYFHKHRRMIKLLQTFIKNKLPLNRSNLCRYFHILRDMFNYNCSFFCFFLNNLQMADTRFLGLRQRYAIEPLSCLSVSLSVCLLACLRASLSVCNVGVLWPHGWVDQDETWCGGRPRPQPHVLDRDPAPPPKKGAQPPSNFRPMSWLNGWMDQDATWYRDRRQPR